ncbi:hypothetical protein Scep_019375 [Stephania cephalantha]|uniref:Uncharacterized protein n=1 Tax=Stephania cephalantha TaxID=152367 RepID=A0AAP0IBP2_9MAGN
MYFCKKFEREVREREIDRERERGTAARGGGDSAAARADCGIGEAAAASKSGRATICGGGEKPASRTTSDSDEEHADEPSDGGWRTAAGAVDRSDAASGDTGGFRRGDRQSGRSEEAGRWLAVCNARQERCSDQRKTKAAAARFHGHSELARSDSLAYLCYYCAGGLAQQQQQRSAAWRSGSGGMAMATRQHAWRHTDGQR